MMKLSVYPNIINISQSKVLFISPSISTRRSPGFYPEPLRFSSFPSLALSRSGAVSIISGSLYKNHPKGENRIKSLKIVPESYLKNKKYSQIEIVISKKEKLLYYSIAWLYCLKNFYK